MAFVLVQHLDPGHKSILAELLRRCTQMDVFEVEQGMVVQPNSLYVIPPNHDMALLNGELQLLAPGSPHGQRMPIDFFFRSLAQDLHKRAIGVVLSGSGKDGTEGSRAIKAEGGMIIVQQPESADYDGMPRSAIDSGLADFVLPPDAMPTQLLSYEPIAEGSGSQFSSPSSEAKDAFNKICVLLRAHTGHDFSRYKTSSVVRRIERRMTVHQIRRIEDYLDLLQKSSDEIAALFDDILIGVTNFFRDPEAFRALEEKVIPRLVASSDAETGIRIWVPGCSTGEEAYSVAILVVECMEKSKKRVNTQIFATDIDQRAIARARAGSYSSSISADMTQDRLDRFFRADQAGTGYQISKVIRDMLVFSEQSLVRDPPFSRLDLICCRNLLIYMNGELQDELIPLFHYALKSGGYLFLGTSETVGNFRDLFASLDNEQKIYQRKANTIDTNQKYPGKLLSSMTRVHADFFPRTNDKKYERKRPLRELTEQALLQELAQAAALINTDGDILYIHGRTGMYLEPAPGESTANNIRAMAREGLLPALSEAMRQCAQTGASARRPALEVKTNGEFTSVNLIVRPVPLSPENSAEPPLYLVIFNAAPKEDFSGGVRHTGKQPSKLSIDKDAAAYIVRLEQELHYKDEYLRTSTEELKSANEEMQSVNEELQSTNEELKTSKEELQSLNEELSTVNGELESKLADLSQANNDMNNLLAGTGIATVFVDLRLNIMRFTPTAKEIINLIPADIGRPVAHVASNLRNYGDLVTDAKAVLDTLVPREVEVQDTEGRWFNMRIQPYRTDNNVIEGAVITFVEITDAKEFQSRLKLNQDRLWIALRAAAITVTNQDLNLRYTWARGPVFGFAAEEVLGKTDAELLSGEEAALLSAIKQEVLASGIGTRQLVSVSVAGKAITYDLTVEPLLNTLNTMVGVTCAARENNEAIVDPPSL